MKAARPAFVIGFLFLVVVFSSAQTNIYIAQNAAGANSGADCADAHSAAWFNTSANWGSGATQIGPGDTVHLCGTFAAATANSSMLTVQGSGSSGSPITILFESGAVLTSPSWGNNGAINVNGKQYITINGDTSGGRQGVIRNTAAGTSAGNATLTTRGISCSSGSSGGCHHLIVKNITIGPIYIHVPNATNIDQANTNAIQCWPCDNVTIDNVLAHDAGWMVNANGNNLTLSNSDLYNFDHGIAFGPGSNVGGLTVVGNHFHDMANWDTGSADAYHHDYIHIWATGVTFTGGNIYNNTFDGDSGTCCTTAHIFLEDRVTNLHVFNNVFITPPGRTINILWPEGNSPRGLNNAFYNNYIDAGSAGGDSGMFSRNQDGLIVINNYWRQGATMISLQSSAPASINNNMYEQPGSWGYGSTDTGSFATWKGLLPAGSGQDSASQFDTAASTNMDGTGHPQAGSAAIGAAQNLSALCAKNGGSLPDALCADAAGASRPASGAWDIGAYQLGSSASAPTPPSALTAIVQ